MEKLTKIGRLFYGLAIAGIGFQQIFYGDFHAIILPPLHAWIPGLAFWAYFTGTLLIISGAAIAFYKHAARIAMVLGCVFLALFCFYYIPYEFIIDPYYRHLGQWGNAQKEMALAGGAFIISGSFLPNDIKIQDKFLHNRRLIVLGGILFSITMISFGIDHFLYTAPISTLIPAWIPWPIFWTYLAAVALIASGLGIILRIKLTLIGSLLGSMIFIWLISLHIPRSIVEPFANQGNEVTSAFSALAFSGIALAIAGTSFRSNDHSPILP